MSSVSSSEIRSAAAYSSDSGSGTQVIIRWRSFTLGAYSSGIQAVTINTELNVNSQGASSGGQESQNRRVSIWLNGTQVLNQADAFGSNTYSATGRLSIIRIVLSAEGRSNIAYGPAKTPWATPSFDYSINLTDINAASDFIFINSLLGKYIQLPPVISNTRKLYFFKLTNSTENSDMGGNQYRDPKCWVNTYNGDSIIADVNSSAVCIDKSFGCLTLFNDGIKWYIANYYPSNRQTLLPTTGTATPTGRKIASASINAINIFSTTSVGVDNTRTSGDNQVNLPATSPPSMCIVVYSGDATCGRSRDNALMFSHSRSIDNNTGYTATNKPYIVTQSGISRIECSTGIVFISDGTTWYIAGWAESGEIQWLSSGGGSIAMGVDSNQIDIVGDTSAGQTKDYYLPITPKINPGYFIISKQLSTSATNAVKYHSFKDGGTTANVFNENTQMIYYQRPQTNVCMWFVGIKDGSITRYYPIIAYFQYG